MKDRTEARLLAAKKILSIVQASLEKVSQRKDKTHPEYVKRKTELDGQYMRLRLLIAKLEAGEDPPTEDAKQEGEKLPPSPAAVEVSP